MSEPKFSSSDYDRDFEEGAEREKEREEYEQRQAEDPFSWTEGGKECMENVIDETSREKLKDLKQQKGRFDDFSVEVITPIMQKIFEVAFHSIEQFYADSEKPVLVPVGVREGLLETMEEIIEHCKGKVSHYEGVSLFGFALGRDGMKPVRQFRSMVEITTALRDLIKAKDDQIKAEASEAGEHEKRERMAAMLGF